MKPAARVGDPTGHGTPLSPGPGSPNVLIGNRPAWRATLDQHACPVVNLRGADGVGSVLMGSPTVLINNQMACRMGDIVIEKPGAAIAPTNPIVMGEPTVLIGEGGIASQIAITHDALRRAANFGVPLIQICPECQPLSLLTKLPSQLAQKATEWQPGTKVTDVWDLFDAARLFLKAYKTYNTALQTFQNTDDARGENFLQVWRSMSQNLHTLLRGDIREFLKTAQGENFLQVWRSMSQNLHTLLRGDIREFLKTAQNNKAYQSVATTLPKPLSIHTLGKGFFQGALKTALNNLDDLTQRRYGAFAAKVGYGALRGLIAEGAGTLAAKGGALLGTAFPPLGGAIGGYNIGRTIGGLFGEKGAKIGARVGGILGAVVGLVPGVGHFVGPALGAIGAKMWAKRVTEHGFDALFGGEQKIDERFGKQRHPP
jgi:uncharacterized Zn-binding protein involved in type VI secretion